MPIKPHFGLQDPRFQTVVMPMILPVTVAAAATLTPAQTMSGLLNYTGGAANLTLPNAADLSNAISGAMVGTSFELMVKATGAGTVTLVAGTGVTLSGTATVAAASIRTFLFNFTNVTPGTEAYTVYSEGTGTF